MIGALIALTYALQVAGIGLFLWALWLAATR